MTTGKMEQFIAAENEQARRNDAWRALLPLEKSGAREIMMDGARYLNFSSNDYLGYSTDPRVIAGAQKALAEYGCGGRSSRLVSGTLELHHQLERQLAKLKGTESALLFPTGFMANLGVISALLGPGDAVILDRLNHASLIDAAILSRARIFLYNHADMESLEKILIRTRSYGKRLVVTDSLFSMDGDFAPLPEIAALCEKYRVWLMVDDAHAVGIFGKGGGGMAEHFGLQNKIEISVGTCSKALGSQGGFVCGSKDFIDFLINRSRPFIYTTAISPASAGAALSALKLLQAEPEKRERLLDIAASFSAFLKKTFQHHPSSSQIVPLLLGSNERSLAVSRHLKELKIFAPAIRPPTVPKDQSRLRFSITSAHEAGDIRRLKEALCEAAASSLFARVS